MNISQEADDVGHLVIMVGTSLSICNWYYNRHVNYYKETWFKYTSQRANSSYDECRYFD